jgi:hypothetical protein
VLLLLGVDTLGCVLMPGNAIVIKEEAYATKSEAIGNSRSNATTTEGNKRNF